MAQFFTQNVTVAKDKIQAKEELVEVPAKGNVTLFNQGNHPSLKVTLSNQSIKNACEVYTVEGWFSKKNWVSPSLFPKKSLTFKVAKNGSVFIENYSEETFTILVKVH